MPTSSQALIILAADGRLPKKVPRRTFPVSSVPYPTRSYNMTDTCMTTENCREDDTENIIDLVKLGNRVRNPSVAESLPELLKITGYKGQLTIDPESRYLRWQINTEMPPHDNGLYTYRPYFEGHPNTFSGGKTAFDERCRFPDIVPTKYKNNWTSNTEKHILDNPENDSNYVSKISTENSPLVKRTVSLPSLFQARLDEKLYRRLCTLGFRKTKQMREAEAKENHKQQQNRTYVPSPSQSWNEDIQYSEEKDFRIEDLKLRPGNSLLPTDTEGQVTSEKKELHKCIRERGQIEQRIKLQGLLLENGSVGNKEIHQFLRDSMTVRTEDIQQYLQETGIAVDREIQQYLQERDAVRPQELQEFLQEKGIDENPGLKQYLQQKLIVESDNLQQYCEQKGLDGQDLQQYLQHIGATGHQELHKYYQQKGTMENKELQQYLKDSEAFFEKFRNYELTKKLATDHQSYRSRTKLPKLGHVQIGFDSNETNENSDNMGDGKKEHRKLSLLEEVREKSNYNKWKKKRLTSVRLRRELPPIEPLSVCFSLRDNAKSHEEIKSLLEEQCGSHVDNIQFDPINVVAIDTDAPSRWIVRMRDKESRDYLVDMGLIVDGDHVEVKLLDELVKEEVEAFRFYEMVQKGQIRMPGSEVGKRRRTKDTSNVRSS